MNGRIEKDNKVKEKTLNRLKGQPEIITSYYYSMGNKTALTRDSYVRQVINFLRDIQYDDNTEFFSKLKPSDISQYLDKISINEKTGENKSDRYIATIYFSISHFFDFLVSDGYIESNICEKISPPHFSVETTPVYLTEDEICLVKEKIEETGHGRWKSRDMLIFILGCTTGLRVSSISEMNLSDVDIDNRTILVTEKGNKRRECKLGGKTIELLQEWILNRNVLMQDKPEEQHDALFINKYRTRMSVHGIEVMINKYTNFLGKHITPHKLRHTCGTLLFKEKGNIKLVQEVLGHKNIANTMIYTHISDEMKQEAADAMDAIV